MEQPAITEHLVRKYLLGQLPERERERLEVGLLRDDRYYETLTTLEDEVEDELIDQYLDGELTETERENFERVFLKTPERAHKLKVIKDLKEHAKEPEPEYAFVEAKPSVRPLPLAQWNPLVAVFQNPIVGLSMAAALLLTMLCCLWLAIRTNSLEDQLKYAQSQGQSDLALKEQVEQLRKNNEELSAQLKSSEERRANLEQDLATLQEREKPSPSSIASITLISGMRSSDSQTGILSIPRDATEARLTLEVEDVDPRDYKRFRALVKTQGGKEVWRSENVKLQSRGRKARTTLDVPVKRLTNNEYTVDLEGVTSDDQIEALGLFSFRAVAK